MRRRGHHPGAPLRRGSGAQFPAVERPADAGRASARTCASMPGSRRAPRSARSTIPCSRRSSRTARRARPRSRSCERHLRRRSIDGIETNLAYLRVDARHPVFRRRRADHRDCCEPSQLPTAERRSAGARHADHRAGLARTRSATGMSACRRPARWMRCALRLANRLVGNRRRRGGARDDGHRADAALRQPTP